MQREALEFHDSVLAKVERGADELRLLFEPAYVHRSSGDPARDAGTGWSVNVQLTLFGVTECRIPSNLPGDVWEGSLRVGESAFDNLVPIPLELAAATHIVIKLNSGNVLRASGTRVTLLVVGSYEFVENVSAG
jgi:hypothetical protein